MAPARRDGRMRMRYAATTTPILSIAIHVQFISTGTVER